jgi:urea transport system ATP-binding protein
MLQIENLQSGYGGGPVLRGVSLSVAPGEVLCLMGRNGVGKSTLLKSLMGILRAGEGRITWDKKDITRAPTDARARAGIAYVPQGREVFPHMSVQENLHLGLEAAGSAARRANRIPERVWDMFPMLGKMLHRKGGSLSGGQQQQLAIGRALASSPRLLLLDEPMEGIQPNVVMEIERAIEKLKASGDMGIILVEQTLDFALRIADHITVLDKGVVVAQGARGEMDEATLKSHLTI